MPEEDDVALARLRGYPSAEKGAAVYREWRDLGASVAASLIRAGETAKERDGGRPPGGPARRAPRPAPCAWPRTWPRPPSRRAHRGRRPGPRALIVALGSNARFSFPPPGPGSRGRPHRDTLAGDPGRPALAHEGCVPIGIQTGAGPGPRVGGLADLALPAMRRANPRPEPCSEGVDGALVRRRRHTL
jgi:hypothetical protein